MSKGRRPKRPKDPLRLTHRTVRGHLGWAVPASLGLVLAAWLAILFAQFQSAAEDVAEPEVLESNAQILEAVIIAVLVMTLLVSLPGLRSVWRSWRRSRLAFSKAEREVVDHRRAQRHWWMSAAALRRAAAGDGIPQVDSPRELVPLNGEKFYFEGIMGYSRWYGMDAVMHMPATIVSSNPWLMVGGAIGAAAGRRRARAQADAITRVQWREGQAARVVVTDRRILCLVAQRGWLSFYYRGATSFHPDIENWTFVMDFDDTSALRLQGYHAPAAAIAAVRHLRGADGVAVDPDLSKLETVAPDHWLDPYDAGDLQPLTGAAR